MQKGLQILRSKGSVVYEGFESERVGGRANRQSGVGHLEQGHQHDTSYRT